MPRRRKIFPAHAGELAHRLLNALERDRGIARFVDSYIAEHDRRGLKADALQYRELLERLRREALLVMAGQVNAALPRYLTARRPAVLRGPETQAADAFRAEFFGSLERALGWTRTDTEEFHRDLNLFAQLAPRPRKSRRRRKLSDPPAGPFVDRCALLLDPSMLEKARRAAGRFQFELERLTEKTMNAILRRR